MPQIDLLNPLRILNRRTRLTKQATVKTYKLGVDATHTLIFLYIWTDGTRQPEIAASK